MDYPQYQPDIADAPLNDEEISTLDAMLQALPSEAAMNVEALDGYLTALLVGPPLLASAKTADWLPAVWGGDGADNAPFQSNKQRKRVTMLVLRHLRAIDGQLRDVAEHPERWQPVFSVAEADGVELVDAEDWCAGFLQAVPLAAEAWGALFDDARFGPALVPLALLGGDESELSATDAERLADPAVRDELSRAVMDAVTALRLRP
jgi:uncharacterized protein